MPKPLYLVGTTSWCGPPLNIWRPGPHGPSTTRSTIEKKVHRQTLWNTHSSLPETREALREIFCMCWMKRNRTNGKVGTLNWHLNISGTKIMHQFTVHQFHFKGQKEKRNFDRE
jgi:hypothetical protein